MRTPQRLSRNEDGASLIIALIFVSLVSVVTITLLSFADSGTRATEALRQQASGAYAADGAAKVAVNELRDSSTFMYGTTSPQSTTHCFGSADTLSLPAFPSAAPTQSAVVTCAPRVESSPPPPTMIDGTINSSNTPGDAILTLGSAGEDGIGFGATTAGNTLQVSGRVRSNSTINTGLGVLSSDTSITAKGACTPPNGLVAPTKTCSTNVTVSDPNYAPPAAETPISRSVPNCPSNGGLVTFLPGVYTDAVALSACDKSNITMWFTKGTYYFNFASTPSTAAVWNMDQGSLVGGTPSPGVDLANQVPSMPGSCVSPFPAASTPTVAPAANAGVEFVFGGASQWVVGTKAQVELCGSYSLTAPPIAIYGLKSGVNGVPAQSGCVTAVPGCAMLSATSDPADRSSLFVQGTLYTPKALLQLSAINQGQHKTNMYFNAGIIVRSLQVFVDGVLPSVVGVPGTTPVAVPQRWPESVAWLQVYVCPNVSPCTTTAGRLQLRAKVGLSEPTDASTPITAGARNVKVYSWAVQR